MKFWNKIKYPLILAVLTLAFAFLRYANCAVPIWCPYFFWAPGLVLQIFSDEIFSSPYVLLEAVFWPIAAIALLLVPALGKYGRWRRFLIRPLLALLVILSLSNWAITNKEQLEDAYWDRKIDAYCREVSDFLDEADEVILHSSFDCNFSPYFEDERIQCACGAYHSVIMIDYDTMQIAFLQHDWITDFHVYKLKPGALTRENKFVQLDAQLPQSQTRLITYYPDEDSSHRTCALELILADGTVYSTTDTPDAHWDNGYLEMSRITGEYMFCVGQPHPEPNDDAE